MKEPELNRGFHSLVRIGTITEQECLVLEQALGILNKIHRSRKAQKVISNPETMKQYLRMKYSCLEREFFILFFLNHSHEIIKEEEIMFKGCSGASPVYPKQIAKRALELGSSAVIMGHNHPTGCVIESSADKVITGRISSALALIDVRLIDHFIIGTDGILSFAEKGLL